MNLSKHFTLAEFCRSSMAARHGVSNELPIELYGNAKATCEMLERIRRLAGDKPIRITSGYRSPRVNLLVGSKPTSDHTQALAADIEPPEGMPLAVFAQALAGSMASLGIGQLILEYPDQDGWVHVSTKAPARAANRILTVTVGGTLVGIPDAKA